MKKKIKRLRYRPMIMLELILAVSIIGLSSSLIIGTPSKVYQKELALLYELEIEREAENFFANLLINFKKDHSFDSITKERKTYPLNAISIRLEDFASHSYNASYNLWTRSEKESNNDTFYKLIGCQLCLDYETSKVKLKKKPNFFTILTRISPQREFLG